MIEPGEQMTDQPTRHRGKILLGCAVSAVVALWNAADWIDRAEVALNGPHLTVAHSYDDLYDLCKHRAISGAPPYVPGSGPHPLAVIAGLATFQDAGQRVALAGDRDPLLNPDADLDRVQLVACTRPGPSGPQIAECTVHGRAVPLHSETVTVTVYEARTAQQVGPDVTITADDPTCPILPGGLLSTPLRPNPPARSTSRRWHRFRR